ncbi:hypothetical protein AVEN_77126-1 [Araneus ventricosus]|uniref:HTH CENPB-type domain-containing protein n=1 Tax=Araneus ventricosus TaxID=182803 RepID=A0A4Y2IPB6_ARAVE|nr:hypothetical protein AVEN_77126-1 [Araneus ventricosus]
MKKIQVRSELEKCFIKWIKQCRDCHLPIGGNELKEKRNNLHGSWVTKTSKQQWMAEIFKNRHNIVLENCAEIVSKVTGFVRNG